MSFSKLNAKYPTFYFNAHGLMVSMIDSTFFHYQLHKMVLGTSRSPVSRRSILNVGVKVYLHSHFAHFHKAHCWVSNATDRTNSSISLKSLKGCLWETLASQYLPWQHSTLIFNNRSPSGIVGVGTNNPFTCPSSASPSPSYPSSVLHFLHSKEPRQYKVG